MALHSRKEFIELCGDQWSDSAKSKISTWIKRGNVIEANSKLDDQDPVNRDWIIKQRGANLLKPQPKREEHGNTPQKASTNEEATIYFALDKQLKAQQLEKLKVDTRLQQLREQKIRGEVVPIDLMTRLFQSHNQAILMANKDFIDQLLINFSQEKRLSSEETARLRGKVTDGLNLSLDKAVNMTSRNMRSITNDYSIKKEVGEHE